MHLYMWRSIEAKTTIIRQTSVLSCETGVFSLNTHSSFGGEWSSTISSLKSFGPFGTAKTWELEWSFHELLIIICWDGQRFMLVRDQSFFRNYFWKSVRLDYKFIKVTITSRGDGEWNGVYRGFRDIPSNCFFISKWVWCAFQLPSFLNSSEWSAGAC